MKRAEQLNNKLNEIAERVAQVEGERDRLKAQKKEMRKHINIVEQALT